MISPELSEFVDALMDEGIEVIVKFVRCEDGDLYTVNPAPGPVDLVKLGSVCSRFEVAAYHRPGTGYYLSVPTSWGSQ